MRCRRAGVHRRFHHDEADPAGAVEVHHAQAYPADEQRQREHCRRAGIHRGRGECRPTRCALRAGQVSGQCRTAGDGVDTGTFAKSQGQLFELGGRRIAGVDGLARVADRVTVTAAPSTPAADSAAGDARVDSALVGCRRGQLSCGHGSCSLSRRADLTGREQSGVSAALDDDRTKQALGSPGLRVDGMQPAAPAQTTARNPPLTSPATRSAEV